MPLWWPLKNEIWIFFLSAILALDVFAFDISPAAGLSNKTIRYVISRY